MLTLLLSLLLDSSVTWRSGEACCSGWSSLASTRPSGPRSPWHPICSGRSVRRLGGAGMLSIGPAVGRMQEACKELYYTHYTILTTFFFFKALHSFNFISSLKEPFFSQKVTSDVIICTVHTIQICKSQFT